MPPPPNPRGIDPGFTALPLRQLADAALSRAADLGCTYADLRVERIREGVRTFRDASLESSTDHTTVGLAVRVVHDGVWGFASGNGLTTTTAAALADRAVATARVSKPLTPHRVELADEPVHRDATWVSAYEVDPFTVDEAERQGRMLDLSATLLAAPGVSHTSALLHWVHENKFFASLAGTTTTQERVRIHPQLTAVSVGEHGFATMRTLAPPVGQIGRAHV